ncbi:MAG: sodium-dependent transporter [Roseivirga sp.]
MAVNVSSDNRGQWGSKFGFIMAAAGSAVGLGNIWRFPYITGENGGGAFVLVYLLCVILIGVPLLFTEMGLGRMTKKSTIGAFKDTGANSVYMGAGAILALGVSFFVLSYYGNIAGWTIGYIFKMLSGSEGTFTEFAANPSYTIPLMGVFVVATVLIVLGGVSGGIEKAAKFLMPLLFVLITVVAIRGLTLEGAMKGVDFYMNPDFSKINANTFLVALGQAFFSMSIGWGIMITYGSYLPKNSNIVSSGVWVGFMDAGVALLAGFMIFPAVFAFGKDPASGPALVFEVLPEVFNAMPGGAIIGGFFFLLLLVAALTSSVSMLEVPASYFMDEKKWSRKKAAWTVGILLFVVGVPSALSKGGSAFFTDMSVQLPWMDAPAVGFQDILDYFFGTFFIVVVALVTCIYVAWKIGAEKIVGELEQGSEKFRAGTLKAKGFIFFIKFVCPLVILAVLLNMMGVFGIFAGGG